MSCEGKETKKEKDFRLSPLRTQTRGRTGMDFTPLVFETSASTDSAIWAIIWNCGAKVGKSFKKASEVNKKVKIFLSNTI